MVTPRRPVYFRSPARAIIAWITAFETPAPFSSPSAAVDTSSSSRGAWRILAITTSSPRSSLTRSTTSLLVSGFSLLACDEPPEPSPAVVRALDSPHDATDIPLRAMAYVLEPRRDDTARVLVAAEFDAERLTYEPVGRARRARVEVSVVARLRDAARGFRHDDTIELTLYEGETAGWRSYSREFLLPAGVAQVRVVLRDTTSGAPGSVTTRVEVPPPGVLRVSTPILSDQVDTEGGEAGRPQVVLAVHREFPAKGPLYVEFEVFGAVADPSGRPRVSAGLQLWSADRRLVRQAPASPIAPSPDGRVVRFVGMDMQGLEAGPYELLLEVHDEVGGRRLRGRERFSLTPAGSPEPRSP